MASLRPDRDSLVDWPSARSMIMFRKGADLGTHQKRKSYSPEDKKGFRNFAISVISELSWACCKLALYLRGIRRRDDSLGSSWVLRDCVIVTSH